MSTLPKALKPTGHEPFTVSRKPVLIRKATPVFKRWKGSQAGSSYGGKAFVDYKGRRLFAEFAILELLKTKGWEGVWVDCYGRRYKTSVGCIPFGQLPSYPKSILDSIARSDKFPYGCWDIFCWRGRRLLFVEAKRKSKDRLRPGQHRWLKKALAGGLLPMNFLLVEWSLSPQ